MNVLDLFSGIGGFSLGLERAGMRTVAFCEIEPYCRAVLRKHWPAVPVYEDVRTLTAARLAADGIGVDIICGGFPCQDISLAGKGAGLEGERSGLWSELHRLIAEIKPRYAIIENVSALRSRGLDEVLRSLAAIGYDAEWHCIPASAVGAPHQRDRIWIVAYAQREQLWEQSGRRSGPGGSGPAFPAKHGSERLMAHPAGQRCGEARELRCDQPKERIAGGSEDVADTDSAMPQERRQPQLLAQLPSATGDSWWLSEPDVGRVATRIPSRVDRLRSLGNAVVPQIPEIIGRAIMSGNEIHR